MRPDLGQTFSFSRIQSFTQCRSFYKHRYISQISVEGTESYFLLGKAYHAALEHVYENHPGHSDITPLALEGLQAFWQSWCKDEGLLELWPDLQDYVETSKDAWALMTELDWRASAACTDKRLQIRNRDGSLPKNASMTSAYKTMAKDLGLYDKQEALASVAEDLLDAVKAFSATMASSAFSLPEVMAESYALVRSYSDFPNLTRVVGVELGFWNDRETGEDTRLELDGFHLQGFIDLVVELDGKLTIVDHKTSQANSDPLSVLYHEQLNLYAYALKTAYGWDVQQIGINHARSNSKTIVAVDWDIVAGVVARQRQHLAAISAETAFAPQNPLEKYSAKPCMGRSKAPYTPDNLKGVCPYLELCHPALHAHLQDLAVPPERAEILVAEVSEATRQYADLATTLFRSID